MTTVLPEPSTDPLLTWRPPTLDDVPAWGRFMLAVAKADARQEIRDPSDLTDEFATPWTDPAANALFAFTAAGEVAAFAWVQWRPGAVRQQRIELWGDVHPAWRGKGVGRFLLAWLEARGRALYASLPGDLPGRLEVNVDAQHDARLAFARRAGFEPARHWVEMRRDLIPPLPNLATPGGIALSPWDRRCDDTMRLIRNEVFADHWGSEPLTEEDWRVWGAGHRNFRPDLSFIAHDGDEIAGYAFNAFYPQDAEVNGFTEGWIDGLGVRRAWRRRGIGAALLAASMRAFADQGLQYASLGVDTENPSGALRLYERLGFVTVRRRVTLAKQLAR